MTAIRDPELHDLPQEVPIPAVAVHARGAMLGGLATIILTFGVLGTWASMAQLDSAVTASGVVVVDSNRRDVQHLDGGIVADLLVGEGSTVSGGDTLLRLDSTRPQAALSIIQGQIDAATALQARHQAEINQAVKNFQIQAIKGGFAYWDVVDYSGKVEFTWVGQKQKQRGK